MTQHHASQALILFAHGARDPAWAAPMLAVQQQLLTRQPGIRVELAFLEQMSPTLPDCVDKLIQDGVAEILIYPMFIAAGSHLKKDLPALADTLQSQYSGLKITLLPAAGEQTAVQHAVATQALSYLGLLG